MLMALVTGFSQLQLQACVCWLNVQFNSLVSCWLLAALFMAELRLSILMCSGIPSNSVRAMKGSLACKCPVPAITSQPVERSLDKLSLLRHRYVSNVYVMCEWLLLSTHTDSVLHPVQSLREWIRVTLTCQWTFVEGHICSKHTPAFRYVLLRKCSCLYWQAIFSTALYFLQRLSCAFEVATWLFHVAILYIRIEGSSGWFLVLVSETI